MWTKVPLEDAGNPQRVSASSGRLWLKPFNEICAQWVDVGLMTIMIKVFSAIENYCSYFLLRLLKKVHSNVAKNISLLTEFFKIGSSLVFIYQ